ncbi:hypothetical protein LTR64_007255 [Lithohypha guttulata]|uniref:uncharacterized protein n=1 Tax=Lithohypha guttulata TaxID=1690604 RepID=UPI002DE1D6B1|nr:hypothetical protein LTR51_004188 [Lithohypha guttulata]
MSDSKLLRRIIVCVDDTVDAFNQAAGTSRSINPSNVVRVHRSIKHGRFEDATASIVEQEAKYYQAIVPTSRFKSTSAAEQQIHDIALDICQALKTPRDEIFLFAAGRGAYVARAVAGLLHHMGIPLPGYLRSFRELYENALKLIKARQQDDGIKGDQALEFLRIHTQGTPNIKFVGIFDATVSPVDQQIYDTSIVTSIRNFRHAMALNENRKLNTLDLPDQPPAKDMQSRSFLQSWFLGSHADITGGTQHDGLSIYPLQWILIEALLQGLVASFDLPNQANTVTENPISLVFPHYAGAVPDLSGKEQVQWRIEYANGVIVNMFDLHSVHVSKSDAQETSHTIVFEKSSRMQVTPRRIFNKKGLNGYDPEASYGTIIHPSAFCILSRNQRFLEQPRFKLYKENLADFEFNCLRSDADTLPPWLENSQLLASGVKAFRILVCGKTGVGKSTLINKVFGVEMTEESTNYTQGVHDINKAFESPNHPGLLIHDSRGWQAGSDQELDLIAQFLRHRAYQKEAAEALHVIWFCVDADVSRIEEADKRTFETIAQYSNHVPVFVVGTKKDKLVGYRKMQLLEEYMQKLDDYQEANRLATIEADKVAQEQFLALRDQLSQIKSYKADGYVCLSKNDEAGIKNLLSQTLDTIVDDRVRLFCVAAQVVDVNQKIDSAITECMRLGTHAVRTAMVPLPFSGMIGTPTVSRIICEHVLQCFGFPKAMPEEVEDIMSRIVMGNLKQFMSVSMTQFLVVSTAAAGLAVGTMGIGAILGVAGSFLSTPPTARMLLKCACDMILILERSFRYSGKYVSVRQIEDAAKQYTAITTTTFAGKTKRLQEHVHDEVDRLIPLMKVAIGWRFNKLRTGFEAIIYKNRFDRPPEYEEDDSLAQRLAELEVSTTEPVELPTDNDNRRAELSGTSEVAELEGVQSIPTTGVSELPGSISRASSTQTPSQTFSDRSTVLSPSLTPKTSATSPSELWSASTDIKKSRSDGSSFFSRMSSSMKIKKTKSAKS